jgi:membrane protein
MKKIFTIFVDLLRDSVSAWIEHKAPKMGAALAYYTAFSLAPVIILILSLVSLFMKRDEAARGIVAQISELLGADGGKVVQEILTHAGSTRTLSWGTAVSFGILWVSASAAFGELQDSLNTIWEVPKQKHPWIGMLKDRMLSLSMVFVLGFFMMTSLLISTFIDGLTSWWTSPESKIMLAIFRMLPDTKLTWSDVLPGALFSSVLFLLGKFLLGLYIAHSSFASSYGAAASFLVILVWVFYSAQILYFGAEFTRAYTRRLGSHQEHASAKEPPLKEGVEKQESA